MQIHKACLFQAASRATRTHYICSRSPTLFTHPRIAHYYSLLLYTGVRMRLMGKGKKILKLGPELLLRQDISQFENLKLTKKPWFRVPRLWIGAFKWLSPEKWLEGCQQFQGFYSSIPVRVFAFIVFKVQIPIFRCCGQSRGAETFPWKVQTPAWGAPQPAVSFLTLFPVGPLLDPAV